MKIIHIRNEKVISEGRETRHMKKNILIVILSSICGLLVAGIVVLTIRVVSLQHETKPAESTSTDSAPTQEVYTPNTWNLHTADRTSVNVKDIVIFGQFEQDNDKDNGAENIEWIVMRKEKGKALLMSRYILDVRKFNETRGDVYWENSDIRKWLNGDFYKSSFTQADKDLIYTYERDDIKDNVFLLSADEAGMVKSAATKECWAGSVTTYAENQIPLMVRLYGWWMRNTSPQYKSNVYIAGSNKSINDTRICHYMYMYDGEADPDDYRSYYDGVPDEYNGVRPCVWVSLY